MGKSKKNTDKDELNPGKALFVKVKGFFRNFLAKESRKAQNVDKSLPRLLKRKESLPSSLGQKFIVYFVFLWKLEILKKVV